MSTGGEYGKLYKSAWGDADFKALTEGEQALYQKLISQPDMSLAGVLTYAPARWAGQTSGLTIRDVEKRLGGLVDKRFIVHDVETQEVLIRSYIRNDLGWRSPRTMIGIANAVRRILSERLRAAISAELLRADTTTLADTVNDKTGRSTRQVVEGVIGELVAETPAPDTPSDTPCDTPCDTPSDGVCDTPSHTVSAVRFDSQTATATATANTNANANANAPTELEGSSALALLDDASTDVAAKTKRGTRLPDGWQPARTTANENAEADHDPDWLRRQLDRFRDHWAAQSGTKGVKADWDATWRNWIRRATDFEPKRTNRMGDLTNNDWSAMAARLQERSNT